MVKGFCWIKCDVEDEKCFNNQEEISSTSRGLLLAECKSLTSTNLLSSILLYLCWWLGNYICCSILKVPFVALWLTNKTINLLFLKEQTLHFLAATLADASSLWNMHMGGLGLFFFKGIFVYGFFVCLFPHQNFSLKFPDWHIQLYGLHHWITALLEMFIHFNELIFSTYSRK